jgi:hypothetical protein
MKTLHDAAAREEIVGRLDRLRAEARPLWGRMNVGQMLCHLRASLCMALGELPTKSKNKRLFQTALMRRLAIYWLPWPRGLPTAPELLATPPADFAADAARLRELVGRYAASPIDGPGPEHPLFGRLTRRDWSVLQYRHADHHLRQFGA